METASETPQQRHGGIVNYFQGATIHNLVINGNMTKSGTENYHAPTTTAATPHYTDKQIASALANIVGEGKAIDSKQKWAGAHWLLRWLCNYPPKAQDFCDRIARLPLPQDLPFKCDYRNIRELCTLSFMDEDARQIDSVRYSKADKGAYLQMREVVIALADELQRQASAR